MSLSRIPLPSIALVLTSDHTAIPSRPSVIKIEFDPLQTIYPMPSVPTHMPNLTDAQVDLTGVQTDQYDNQPAVDEQFFFHIVDDSLTNVDSDNDQRDDELDAQTVFAEKRPTTSRGSPLKSLKSDIVLKTNFVGLANIIHNLLLPFKLKRQSAQVTKVAVDK